MIHVQVIRTSGAIEEHDVPHLRTFEHVYRLIGADTLDFVNLRDGRVMLVDDDGWECRAEQRPYGVEFVPVQARKPINPTATALYHAVCVPGATHQIVGDVAIVTDADFA